jgi:hypothetical protein
MPFNGKQRTYKGVDLNARTSEIERMALAGVYHFEIAKLLGISASSVEQTMAFLRRHGRIGSMRGPRKNVVNIDWALAESIWRDLAISQKNAIRRIGCSERTIYRRFGGRSKTDGETKLRRSLIAQARERKKQKVQRSHTAPEPATQKTPFRMSVMSGRDPDRDAKIRQIVKSSVGRV